jgi:hypothetical protein
MDDIAVEESGSKGVELMASTGIPDRLLNSTATIYQESAVPGAMGEPVIRLKPVTSVPCRADQRSATRQAGDYHATPHIYKVYINGGMDLTGQHWIKISNTVRSVIGQVVDCKQPGLMAHHIEATIICREVVPEVAS